MSGRVHSSNLLRWFSLVLAYNKGYRPVNSETPSWGGGGSSRALKRVTFSKINSHDILLFDLYLPTASDSA